MACIKQNPDVDYFSLNKSRPQQSSVSPAFTWDSNPYNNAALVNSDSCDSVLTSPTSPESINFPTTPFELQKSEIKQSFNFGSFEDWMRWDDPSDAALSPTSDFFPELKLEPMSPNMGSLGLQGSRVGGSANISDDSAVFVEDPVSEEPLFQTPGALLSPQLADIPPREGLYSAPLSWSRPTPGSRQLSSYNAMLTPQQESKLRDIAMPPRSQEYPASPSSTSSPEPYTNNRKKRKSSMEDDDDSPPPSRAGRSLPVKKTAHNMIEKRYRTNLNDKIAALRDSVPSLRVMSKKSRREEVEEDLQGLTPAHKLNKATVLSKATEYIAHLEKRNRYLTKENASLKSRVDAFEILIMSRQPQNQRTQSSSRQGNPSRYDMMQ